MIMAVLEDDTLCHPPIEALFTTDEETGMYGAEDFDVKKLKGSTFINLDSGEEGVLTVGNTHTIQATLLPETTTDTDLAWSVNDESIATVDENGTVTAQSPGNCVVTAATPDGALKATYSLTVKAKQTVKAASNTSTTTPSYTAPSAPSASTPTYVPEPAPAPAPAPAEPSQPSGGDNGSSNDQLGGLNPNDYWVSPDQTDWTQDESNMSNSIDFDN